MFLVDDIKEISECSKVSFAVAPRCNISCNYCNSKYDCLNKSKSYEISKVLTPEEAFNKFIKEKERIENIKMVEISGPGDVLANIDNTRKTIKLIQSVEDRLIFSLSTNGLMIPVYFNRIMKLGISHVTIAINTIRSEIGAKIHRYIYFEGKRYYGIEGAEILIKNQLLGLKLLSDAGIKCDVNIIAIKDINDNYIEETVKQVKKLGAITINIKPLIPVKGSKFENMNLINAGKTRTINKI